MEFLLNRPVVVLAVLAALVMALLHGLGGERPASGPEAPADAAPWEPGAGTPLALRATPSGWMQRAGAVARGAPASAQVPRRVALARAFESADDLYVFLQSLIPAAAAGDADAAWMTSRVYDYCAAHAMDPAGYARDTDALARRGLDTRESMVRARDRVGHRCRQFLPGDGIDRGLVILQRLKAVEAGSLAAEAALLAMGEPLEDSQEYRRDLVQRVQASADPESFSALAPAMGPAASGHLAHVDQVAGTTAAELAWQLGACELGLDCTSEGALMTAYCANGGVCSRSGHRDFPAFVRDAVHPPGGADAIDELVDSLLREGVPR